MIDKIRLNREDSSYNELVFFWFKDNNIFKEGFQLNFRSNNRYNFNNNVLTCEKKGYKHNFFANNININVIVGENGTGKSTILKYLNSILMKQNNIDFEYLVIFSNGRYLKNQQLKIDNQTNITLLDGINDSKLMYRVKHYDSEKNFNEYFSYNNLNISSKSINKFIHESVMHSDEHNFNLFKFTPTNVNLKLLDYKQLTIKCITSFYNNLEEFLLEERLYIVEKFYEFLIFIESKYENYLYFIFNEILNKTYLIDTIYNLNINDFEDINDMIDSLGLELYRNIYDEFKSFIKEYNINGNDYTTISLNDDVINCLLVLDKIFDIDYFDNNSRSYKDLSYGEKTAFGLFVNIYEFMADRAFKTCILLLDEPDISLHPNWQKELINDLVCNFKDKENYLNIIITTHSPILLSDLPSDNVTYLVKENSISKIEIKENLTFGANIHTLLNDSFYMKNGTSGMFAKEKINKLIMDLQTQDKLFLDLEKEEILYTINQIGEPYLKYKILNIFEEKYKTEMEIEKLKKQRDDLNIKIESLEKEK